MDRNATSIPKMQATFIEFVVLPTIQSLTLAFPALNFIAEHAKSNLSMWRSMDTPNQTPHNNSS